MVLSLFENNIFGYLKAFIDIGNAPKYLARVRIAELDFAGWQALIHKERHAPEGSDLFHPFLAFLASRAFRICSMPMS